MDKHDVILQARAFFESKITSLGDIVESTRGMAMDAPGRIASRYDTSREETGWLADGQTALLNEWRRSLASLAGLSTSPCDRIQTGSLCVLRSPDRKARMVCLVCPGGSGFECDVGSEKVLLVSPASPLIRAAAGLACGDCFELTPRSSYVVEEVW